MADASQKISRTIWIGIGLVIVLMAATLVLSKAKLRQRQRNIAPAVIGPVADFALTNQAGQTVTLADLRGRVWVADIIFTRCAGPCPRMSRRMASLQAALASDSAVRLVSLTTDPEFDTPEVLARYATRYGADPKRWQFLTGTKKAIVDLSMDSLKLGSVPVKPEERANENDLFIHSTYFVVVDPQARLRRVFESSGEGIEWTNVQRDILATIRTLERTP